MKGLWLRAGIPKVHTFVCAVCGAKKRVAEHGGRLPLAPLEGWEFTSEGGCRCPKHPTV